MGAVVEDLGGRLWHYYNFIVRQLKVEKWAWTVGVPESHDVEFKVRFL